MSSLQLAAGKGRKTPHKISMTNQNQTKPSSGGKRGFFENSFQGLDLSEFSSAMSSSSSTSKSASAQLLQKKRMEAKYAYEEEQEEIRMKEEAFMRAQKQSEQMKKQQNDKKPEKNMVFSALISMHKGDTNGGGNAILVGKKKNLGRKHQKQFKRNSNVSTITKSSGKKITKKSKGTKYY